MRHITYHVMRFIHFTLILPITLSNKDYHFSHIRDGVCVKSGLQRLGDLPTVIDSYCFSNKLPQTEWFKATQTYYLIILEARNLKWVYKALVPFGASRKEFISLPFYSIQSTPIFLGSWPLIIPIAAAAASCQPPSLSLALLLCLKRALMIYTGFNHNLGNFSITRFLFFSPLFHGHTFSICCKCWIL